ncbi:hypothetical protein GCM10027515_29480 [Schumannella luteola]
MAGEDALALWQASVDASDALQRRQLLVDALPSDPTISAAEVGGVGGVTEASPTGPPVAGIGYVAGEPAPGWAGPRVSGPASRPAHWGAPPSRSGAELLGPAIPLAPSSAPASDPAVAASIAGAPPQHLGSPNPVAAAPRPDHASQLSVQSVLAVAGAGLFAVAALVFSFFNPDLTDAGARTAIVGTVTVIFLVGAWLLRRRDLVFSGEAIGGLGVVFIGLDVVGIAQQLAVVGPDPWVLAAIGSGVGGALLATLGTVVRLRTWVWTGMVAIVTVPVLLTPVPGSVFGAELLLLASVALAIAWPLVVLARLEARLGTMRVDRVTATSAQIALGSVVICLLPLLSWRPDGDPILLGALVTVLLAALCAVAARGQLPGFFSFATGLLATGAALAAPLAIRFADSAWYVAVVPAAAVLAMIVLAALPARLLPQPRMLDGGALTALIAVAFPVAAGVALVLTAPLTGPLRGLGQRDSGGEGDIAPGAALATMPPSAAAALVVGLLAVAAGFAIAPRLSARRGSGTVAGVRTGARVALWLGAAAVLGAALWPGMPLVAQVSALLAVAVATALALRFVPRLRRVRPGTRAPLAVLAHLAALAGVLASWADSSIVVIAGIGGLVAVAFAAATVPRRMRFWHVGVGTGWALFVLATALDLAGVEQIVLLSIVTSAAALLALVATLVPRIPARWWLAVLIVAVVPFSIGVISVLFERSGWTALSTTLIGAVAFTLLVIRSRAIGVAVRTIAASIVVPSLAVAIISLGAQLLSGSASPVTLPIIAVVVAAMLGALGAIESRLADRLPAVQVRTAVIAIEASTYVTGAIAVLLALVREASGLGTTCLVLLIAGIGAAASAVFARRRSGWWLAAACWTGALWCVWALAGVGVPEPYLLPPTLGAAIVGVVLLLRRGAGLGLASVGLAAAVAPTLALLAVVGNGEGAVLPWRTIGLLAASLVLLLAGALVRPGSGLRGRLVGLQLPLVTISAVAATATLAQGIRLGARSDATPLGDRAVMAPALLLAVGGALLVLGAAVVAVRSSRALTERSPLRAGIARSRWVLVTPVALLALTPLTAIRHEWFAIWAMWTLMMALLALVVVIARATLHGATALPPAWIVYTLAWIVGVAGWSQRELRVEVFSLPLGLAVLAAGAVHFVAELRPGARERWTTEATLDSWPAGFRGSRQLLAPGLVLTLLPSVVATGTDPQTWRAILVIAVALVAILGGVTLRLHAPFVIGIAALPIENVVVFASQLGRGIQSLPWWITLATAGAVLLAIAVGSERRTNRSGGVAARLRELR